MIKINHHIKIQHETFGELLNEMFIDSVQFKLFLKMIQSSIELNNDLTFFNGSDFLIHIPIKHLKNSIIISKVGEFDLNEYTKSKIETLV